MRKICRYVAVAFTFGIVAWAMAQDRSIQTPENSRSANVQPSQTQTQSDTNRPGNQPANRLAVGQNQSDIQLALWLASECEQEIALAQFAIEQTDSDTVREFAEQEIFDHSKLLGMLRKFLPASEFASTSRSDEDQQSRLTTPQSQTQRFGFRPGSVPSATGPLDFLRIKQEIDQQSVASLKDELAEREGADFDTCFLGHQMMSHLHMAVTMKVMKDYASSEFRSVIEEGEKLSGEHLDHAQEILRTDFAE